MSDSKRAIAQCGLHAVVEGHVVVSVNAKDVFDHVDVAADVDAVDGHTQREALGCLMSDLYF